MCIDKTRYNTTSTRIDHLIHIDPFEFSCNLIIRSNGYNLLTAKENLFSMINNMRMLSFDGLVRISFHPREHISLFNH